MTLNLLLKKLQNTKFPIRNREELIKALGKIEVKYEGKTFDSRDISMMIKGYPIKSMTKLLDEFLKDAKNTYADTQVGKELAAMF